MISFAQSLKLILPVAFFGYAAAANVALFTGEGLGLTETDLTRGGITAEVDTLYATALPHKDPSVGWIGALRYALLGEGRDGVVVGDDHWLYTTEEFRFADAAPRSMAETVAGMAELQAKLAEEGAELIVVPLPTKLEVESAFAPGREAVARSVGEYDQFLGALSAADISYFEARDVFAARGDGVAFLRTDTHWTPGTAEAVAQALGGSGLVETGEDSFTRVASAPQTFQGDLVTFITSDALAGFVGLRPETVEPWVAEPDADALGGGGLDLFGGGDAVEVVLVGTSYSANPNWSFVEAMKVALGRDVLNLATEGQGPIVPMLDFVETGLAALDAPPKVVIWEFPVRYLADPKLWPAADEEERADA